MGWKPVLLGPVGPYPLPQSLKGVLKYSAKVGDRPSTLAEPLQGWEGSVGGGQEATAPWPSPPLEDLSHQYLPLVQCL